MSATKKTCKLKKGLRANKATANVSSSDDQSETDSESSSPSLAGTADWSQIKLVNDTVLDSKTLEEYCNKASLSDSDRLMLKEVTQRQLAVLSRNENTVSGLALELFGKKVMEKPQLAPKTQPTPSVTRIIRKLKANADKCDGVGNSVIAATPKPLADKLNDCLSNEWSKVEDVAGLKTSVVTATQENKICNRVGSANERCSKSSVAKKTSQPVRASSEAGGTPRTGCVGGTRKEGDAVAQMDKIEKEKMTRMRTKQAVARQHNHSKTSADAAKTQLPSDRKVKSSGCCSRTHKSSTHGQKADANSLSTTVDFNVDLNDFDFRSFSSEMAKKLREGGKLDKLIAQAVGMGATKMALSGKLEYKCEDVKRLGYCDSKEEILGCHSDNDIDDLSEDDEEDSGDNWSECESVDHAHPHRHHSCDNKASLIKYTRGHVHCDCCYCEMFGHSAAESTKAGRVPQIRERLRLKLKRRNGQEGKSESQSKNRSNCQDKQDLTKMVDKEKTNTDATETTEEAKPVTVGDAPIEEILDYINEKDNAVAQAAASKAAKRARQKQRKQEEKERLEKERKKQEELRKAQEAEALRMKKEKQAAQQAASREKALKAEEKKRKAAEDRARAQKRQKELRELERQQQQAKEQERARKMQAARQAAAKKAAEEKEAARKERAAIPSAEKFSERAESNEPVKEVAQKPHSQVPQKSHSISCSPLPTNNEPRPPSAPSSIPVAQSSTAPDDFVAMSERKQQSILQPSASTLTTFSEGADAPTTKPSLSQVNSLPRQRGVISPDRHPTVRPMHLDEQGLYAAFAMQQSNLTTQLPSTIEQQQQACVDFDYPGFGAVRCSAFATGMPSTAGFYENSLAAALNPLRPPSVPFDPRPVNAATSYVVPPLGTTPYYNGGSISPLSTMAASRMAQCAQAIPAQTLFGTGVDVNTQRPQQHASLSNVTSNGLYCMLGNKCVETPCSSNSSTSSSLCSTSTQQFERLPYTGGLIGGAPLGCGGGGGKCVEKNATAALRLGAGYLSDTSSSCASLPHAVNALSLSTSSLFQNSDPFPLVAPLNNCQPANVNAALQRSAQALNNGLGQLDAVKCGEATRSATFTSVSSLAAPSPLATYESETKMLAAVAEQDSVFAPTQNPMIFEPGDPRIAAAIASMKFDPHETFKPRPDTELEFLDPFEQEIEHFKRVMWEEKNASRARVPLRELPRIEPENEENAVFHFDPLV
ncbi:unnamed protein product [Toxocara canis]|uniref:Uncharacterized protein n=1 Tax=Toxocara canis TaxID=6265 RepID=A0A3P7GZA4_TOXCA|nr:unnamed protein product [Toxocara canis]